VTYDPKAFSRNYYDGSGAARTDTCGLCGDRPPAAGDVLCAGCRNDFDDGDTNMSESVLAYERRTFAERAADKAALDKAAAKKAG
jgi:hypothetical protein